MLWTFHSPMPSVSELPDEGLAREIYSFGPTGQHLYFRWNHGRAFDQCFVCGDPMCEDGGDYVEEREFLPTDFGPDPDPHWVVVCEECSCALCWDELYEEEDYC